MQGDVVRKRVVIHGKVQGVFFRDSLRQRARANEVSGWACNRADGAVEAVLEGRADDVQRILQFCESGPARARVDHVEVSGEAPESLTGFEIR